MKLPSAITKAFDSVARFASGLWPRFGGRGWSRTRLLLPGSRTDWEREAGDLWSNSIVGLATKWLGDRFPRPLLRVCKINRRGDHVPVGRHALVDLWSRPNKHYSRRTLEKAIGLSLVVDGNAYVYLVRDRRNRPVELWWIPHWRITPTWPEDGSEYIDGWQIWLDSGRYTLPVEDVIHIRDGIDPHNERLGLAAVKSCVREVCTVNGESAYTAAILKNSGVPALMVVPDDSSLRPTKDDADRIKERIHDSYSGDNAGETAVLAGAYKVEKVGYSPEELALDTLPERATARIAAAIGVAPMSMGLPDPGKTYSNLGEANRTSWGTIVSIQELIAEAQRWQLLPEFGDDPYSVTVDYDYSEIQEMQEALDALHKRVREDFVALLIRKNEARELLGFEPDPEGDVWYTLPSQTVTSDSLDIADATQTANGDQAGQSQ